MRLFRSRHSLLGAAVIIVHLSAADLHAEIQIDNISSTTPGTFDVDGSVNLVGSGYTNVSVEIWYRRHNTTGAWQKASVNFNHPQDTEWERHVDGVTSGWTYDVKAVLEYTADSEDFVDDSGEHTVFIEVGGGGGGP